VIIGADEKIIFILTYIKELEDGLSSDNGSKSPKGLVTIGA